MSVLLTLVGRRTEIDPNLSDLVFDKHLGRISRTIRPIPIEDTKGPSRPSLRVAATIANDRVGERREAVESREGVERKPLRELEHALCAYGMGSAEEIMDDLAAVGSFVIKYVMSGCAGRPVS